MIVAQRTRELKINYGDFMENVIENYQNLHLHKIFN
jgi:hypothetical protein